MRTVLDDDADFAVRPCLSWAPAFEFGEGCNYGLQTICKLAGPWDKQLVSAMHPCVAAVAKRRKPAMMTVLAVLLRWPDRALGCHRV